MCDYRTLFVLLRMRAHLGLILRVCLILLVTLAPAAAAQPVLIGVLSFRPIDQTLRQWTPLAEYLSRSIPGHEFRVVPLNYPDLDQAVKAGRLDFVFTNPEHFVLLRNQISLAPILTVMPQINGHPVTSFGGVIVTRADRSDINRLEDLAGRSVASPSEQSLGGNLMQLWEMRRQGILFPKVHYLGMPHDRSVQALLDRTVDAAFVRTGVLEAMAAEGKLNLSDIKIISQRPRGDYPQILSTSLYPEWPICSDSKTPETLVKAVSLAMLSIEPGNPIVTAAGFYGFSPPGDYSQVEAVMLRLRVHPGRMDEFDLHDVIDKYATSLLGTLTLLLLLAASAAAYLVVVNRASALLLKQRDAAQLDLKKSNAELEYFSRFNAAIIGASHEGILVYRSDGACILVNPAACTFSGGSTDQLLAQNFRTLASWRESGMIEAAEIGLATGVPQSICGQTTTTFGKTLHMDVTFSRFFLKNEAHLLVNINDVTDRQRTESKMRLAAWVFEFSPEGIAIVDRKHRILSANQAFLTAFNYSMEDLEGRRTDFLFPVTTDRSHLRQAIRALAEYGVWEAEVVAVRKTGAIFPAWLNISAYRGTDGYVTHYVGAISDMSEVKSAQDRIEYLSRYDPLTALPNMIMLNEYFNIACGSASQNGNGMALIYCDLDNFKHTNDSLGHTSGDDLIKVVSSRLKGCVAIGTGDIVCRSGGDEFVILLVDVPDWGAVHASIYAMQAVVSVPIQLGRHAVSVTASFGISRYPDDGQSFELLLQKADAAAYHAKQAGRNTARQFEAAMIDHATERLTMKSDLRLAIDREEFLLHYQPLVDLESGRIVGAEALLRWQSPMHGFVSPVRFIPIAEESGLIVPIGEWVLRQACRQGRRWRDAGCPDLRLAVNISVIQLHSPDFVDTVKDLVTDSGFPPEWLELELTESVMISEADHTIALINELKQFGVRIAIDDFGTGYSCLAYLHNIMADKLKIDRSFVKDLGRSTGADTIITTIINMANSMGMSTLAEGVETEEQANVLRQYGCKDVQGYFFGRPVCLEEFTTIISEGVTR